MQIKLTTDYAIRIVVCLAETGRVTSSTEIAEAMHIPQKYLSKIIYDLKRAGIVAAHSGTRGGYSLAKPPKDISLFDIMDTTEGKMKISRCLEEDEACSRDAVRTCPMRRQYVLLQAQMEVFLKSRTIDQFLSAAESPQG